MRTQDQWNDAIKALEEIHSEGSIFDEWRNDRERFVADLMELTQAAYAGGYEDAMDAIKSASDAMVLAMDESLEHFDAGL